MAHSITKEKEFRATIEHLHSALMGVSTYPANHPIQDKIVNNSFNFIKSFLKHHPGFSTTVMGETFLVENVRINGKNGIASKLAVYLSKRKLESFTFKKRLSFTDFRTFLDVLAQQPDSVMRNGGISRLLTKRGVRSIKVNDVKYGRIDGAANAAQKEMRECRDTGVESGPLTENILSDICTNHSEIMDDVIMLSNGPIDPGEDTETAAQRTQTNTALLNRIAGSLCTGDSNSKKNILSTLQSVISTLPNDHFPDIAVNLGIDDNTEATAGEISRTLYYNALSRAYVDSYITNDKNEHASVQRLLGTKNERKAVLPRIKNTLIARGNNPEDHVDDFEFINNFSPEIPSQHAAADETSDDRPLESSVHQKETIGNELSDLLSKGRVDEAEKLIHDYSLGLDEKSAGTRKRVAEGFHNIISVLDEFDTLKDNFNQISGVLIDKIKQEDHIDAYLIMSDNLKLMCSKQNRDDSYYIDETLVSRLYQANELNRSQIQQLLISRKRNGRSFQYNFGAFNFGNESTLLPFLSQQFKDFSTVNLSDLPQIPVSVLEMIPVKYVKKYLVLPFRYTDRKLFTAIDNPRNIDAVNALQFIAGCSIVPCVAGEYYLIDTIEKHYKTNLTNSKVDEAMQEIKDEEDLEFVEEDNDISQSSTEDIEEGLQGPVVKLVNIILREAINQKASDIHIEPYENELRIRFRVDGILIPTMNPPVKYTSAITSRIKIMSQLDIAERRLPQDGRFKIKIDGRHLDFRVSTFPGTFGEKVVLRLLDKLEVDTDIQKLGLEETDLKDLLMAMYKSKGMILVTGPTGSGKTTTLYSILKKLNDTSKNIITAEDPIEYNMAGINQFQMNTKIGLDFAQALRSFLRQDPDIIMVGEIRDRETVEIATKAALTGHLVLSTLHTNSACDTISRLIDMGVGHFQVASAVNLIIAQRLMRKICPECKEETKPSDLQLEFLDRLNIHYDGSAYYAGKGCYNCDFTGFKGRLPIFEILPFINEIKDMVLRGEPALKIEKRAKKTGFSCLYESGFKKVQQGITTLDELFRAAL